MRNMGFLVYFDTAEAIQGFKTLGTFIVFFSYPWLSWGQAGPDAIQLYAMTESLKIIAARLRLDMEGIYILLSGSSGAQATTRGHTLFSLGFRGAKNSHYTAEAIQGFKALGTFIVFFSYQWLSWGQAGPDAIQFNAMTESL